MNQEEMSPCSFHWTESTAPGSFCPSGQLVPRRSLIRAEGAEGVGHGLSLPILSLSGLQAWPLGLVPLSSLSSHRVLDLPSPGPPCSPAD